MPWVGLNDGIVAGFGETAPVSGFNDIKEYPTWGAAYKSHPELEKLRKSSALSIELAKVDGYQNVVSAHTIKATEAMGYKFMKLPAEACIYCGKYAESEGISLEDAVERVWEKHLSSSAAEVARTIEKGRVRKSYNS